MASPSSRGRAGVHGRGGRRAASRRSSSSPPVYVIVSLVLGAAALLIVFAMNGGPAGASSSSTESAPAGSGGHAGRARAGKPPSRPAPAIAVAVWSEAEAYYDEAADLWNAGQSARRAGNTGAYQQALLDAWDELDELYTVISPYTDWFEEADLEGWAMPADYDELQRRLDKWDNLRSKVKKLKPIGRE